MAINVIGNQLNWAPVGVAAKYTPSNPAEPAAYVSAERAAPVPRPATDVS